jgi:hypothetical protein
MTQDGQQIATGMLKIACVSKRPDGSMQSVEIPESIAMRLKPSDSRTPNLEPRTS